MTSQRLAAQRRLQRKHPAEVKHPMVLCLGKGALHGTNMKSHLRLVGRGSLQHFVPMGHEDPHVHLVVVASLRPSGTHLSILLGPREVFLNTRRVP